MVALRTPQNGIKTRHLPMLSASFASIMKMLFKNPDLLPGNPARLTLMIVFCELAVVEAAFEASSPGGRHYACPDEPNWRTEKS